MQETGEVALTCRARIAAGVVAFDVPFAFPSRLQRGIEINNWGTHEYLGAFSSNRPEIGREPRSAPTPTAPFRLRPTRAGAGSIGPAASRVLLGPRQHPSPESLPPLAHGKDFPAFVRALLGHAPAG